MTKQNMMKNFLSEFSYTEQEVAAALELLQKFEKSAEAVSEFDKYYIPYRDEHKLDFAALNSDVERISEIAGMHKFELHLVFALLLGASSEYFYVQKGYSHELWKECLTDILWKMRECLQVNGFYGSRTFSWFGAWFFADRVTLGRLQFEIIESNVDYKSDRFDIKKGDRIINTHIPADTTRKFDEENCHKAYAMAREFFKDELGNNPVIRCTSWLLWPAHEKYLPEGSNIRRFLSDFEINPDMVRESTGDLWRVFYTDEIYDDPDKYPGDTTIQRAYKQMLKDGTKSGWAMGFVKV